MAKVALPPGGEATKQLTQSPSTQTLLSRKKKKKGNKNDSEQMTDAAHVLTLPQPSRQNKLIIWPEMLINWNIFQLSK